jgi:hypothetical protein
MDPAATALAGSAPGDVIIRLARPDDASCLAVLAARACLVTGESNAVSLQAARDSGLTLLHKPVRAAQLRAAFNHLVAQTLV